MSGELGSLEEDDVQIAQYEETANSPNLPERPEVNEDQEAHVTPYRNQDESDVIILQFDRSNPIKDLLDRGGFRLRMASFYDFPTLLQDFPKYMAQNGLFYTGERDFVMCCHCMTVMKASELYEDSDIRISVCLPNCPHTFNHNAV